MAVAAQRGYNPWMLTVIVPTLNSAATLEPALAALVPAACQGLVGQVVIADGGSCDATRSIADGFGCDVIEAPPGRGSQLAAGVRAARGEWLLFLHADTILEAGWQDEVAGFISRAEGDVRPRAAAFRFALDDYSRRARLLERGVALRCALLALPYGDQGLLISRRHYEALGGFREMPLMEDVDLMRRVGRRSIVMLRSQALTSAVRYRQSGYLRRVLRNAACLTLYFLHVPPRLIVRLYR